METTFYNKRIAGILGILPENTYSFEDEVRDGDSVRNQKIKRNMGYGKRYRAKKDTTTAQLCIKGLQYLLEKAYIKTEEIGAILVTSFTPDYFVPQISNLIQGEFNLPIDVFAVDYWAGCSGYIKGLMNAFMLLESWKEDKKVLLFSGDVINRTQSEKEIYDTPPYGGDAASITILENTQYDCEIPYMLKTNGEVKDLLSFKQGAFADIFHEQKNVWMPADVNGSFRFYQMCVPDIMKQIVAYADCSMDEIEHFFFLQANKLSAQKFADKLGLDRNKVSMDLVEKYGDLSATLNPVSIVDFYGEKLLEKENHFVSICGYGLGAEWGAALVNLGNLICCENIVTDL